MPGDRPRMTAGPDYFLTVPDCAPDDPPLPFTLGTNSGLQSKASVAFPAPNKTKQPPPGSLLHQLPRERGWEPRGAGRELGDNSPEPVCDLTRASLPSSSAGMLSF